VLHTDVPLQLTRRLLILVCLDVEQAAEGNQIELYNVRAVLMPAAAGTDTLLVMGFGAGTPAYVSAFIKARAAEALQTKGVLPALRHRHVGAQYVKLELEGAIRRSR
jgi:hypothetical protein